MKDYFKKSSEDYVLVWLKTFLNFSRNPFRFITRIFQGNFGEFSKSMLEENFRENVFYKIS